MTQAEQYRQQADECMKLAGEASSQEGRALYLKMAESWIALAQEQERAAVSEKE